MRVLVGCEYSGIVRDAFAARGHYAVSCDLLPTESSPMRHIQGNILNILRGLGNAKWDMGIFFPPCTYLTYAGAQYWRDEKRRQERDRAMEFFLALYNAPIEKVAIENPRGWPTKSFRRQDQEINPFEFGEPVRKRVCLWLRGLPPLMPTNILQVKPDGYCIKSNGRRYNYYYHQGKSSHRRARFFKGIAEAMADQWGSLSAMSVAS